jgi:uncharacterized protein YjbJ (UPF0337 family)
MAWQISKRIWDHGQRIKQSDKLMLLALAEHADTDSICWPGLETLRKMVGVNKRSAIRIIEKLEAIGVIYVQHRRGRGNSNRYFVTIGLDFEQTKSTLINRFDLADEAAERETTVITARQEGHVKGVTGDVKGVVGDTFYDDKKGVTGDVKGVVGDQKGVTGDVKGVVGNTRTKEPPIKPSTEPKERTRPPAKDYLTDVFAHQGQTSEATGPNPDDQWLGLRDQALAAFPGNWGRTPKEREIKREKIAVFVADTPDFDIDHWIFIIGDSIAHSVGANNIARFIEAYPFSDYDAYLSAKYSKEKNGASNNGSHSGRPRRTQKNNLATGLGEWRPEEKAEFGLD